MKCIIVLFSLIVAVYSGRISDYRNQLKSRRIDEVAICIPESNANDVDIEKIMNKKTPSRMEGKCLISSFQKKFGLQSEDGIPNQNGLLKLLEPFHDEDPELYNKLIQILLKCRPKVSAMGLKDHCEIATQITSCAITEGEAVSNFKYRMLYKNLKNEDPFGLSD